MGRTATIIAVSYAIVCIAALVPVVGVALSTRSRRATDPRRLAERERTWFVIVIVLLAALLFATIFFTPYGRGESRSAARVLHIRAQQFAWVGTTRAIPAGEEVEFRLTSVDVNHGFAVYTEGGELLFQVQVMPGKTQVYRYTFKRPGTYRVLCLEYCGVDHDAMVTKLRVTG